MNSSNRPPSPIKKRKGEMYRNGKHFQKINRIPLHSSAIVQIGHIESPSSFWIRPKNHITSQLILREPTSEPLLEFESHDKIVGRYCMAPLEEVLSEDENVIRQYGRARILEVKLRKDEELVNVLFIDEGRQQWMERYCLAEMPDKFYYHPWQAIHVSMGGLFPFALEKLSSPSWSDQQIETFKSLVQQFNFFKAKLIHSSEERTDHSQPYLVDLYGLESSYTDPELLLEVDIASLFSVECLDSVYQCPVFNAATYEGPTTFANQLEIEIEDPKYKSFPLDWQNNAVDSEISSEKDWGNDSARRNLQIIHMDKDYLLNNGYRIESGKKEQMLSCHIISACLKSPYEFYGIPLRKFKQGTTEIMSLREAHMSIQSERKALHETFDSFYKKKENRFHFDLQNIRRWLLSGIRIYGIHNCSSMEKRKQFGTYQRVEIVGLDDKLEMVIRFLDTGGMTPLVNQTDVYQIHPMHCQIPAMTMQFCWHGVRDEDIHSYMDNTFHEYTLKAFKENFRCDGVVQLGLKDPDPMNAKEKYGAEKPIPFYMWSTNFVSSIQMSSYFGEETDLLKILEFNDQEVPSRLVIDRTCPLELGDEEIEMARGDSSPETLGFEYPLSI